MRTITALYDSRAEAEAAREQLVASGLASGDITISGQDSEASSSSSGGEHRGFLAGLKDMFMPDEDRHAYHEGISRGGYLLSAQVDETSVDRACEILEGSSAVDFEQRQQQWRDSGWNGQSAFSGGATGAMETGGVQGAEREGVIPIAEERLAVGKREVERGGVRVRSYVRETPVHEQVRLREEHVEVERRPVNERVAGAADGIFEERSFEVSERGEEAVVGKETVITEELQVRKEVGERVEDIEDTVRHTEVDIDDGRTGESRLTDDRTTPRSY
ncbi:YsnF/AvaK domain-containing protein [Phenylobacterium sp.]|jgi:uncharacterized protein (TIGR02271 family)|uniref:YsnF/AvaK domain-containing protein n=1 Tax=Phenylobacterium sp. TaxID=1871053 RepID=UPI002F92C2F2